MGEVTYQHQNTTNIFDQSNQDNSSLIMTARNQFIKFEANERLFVNVSIETIMWIGLSIIVSTLLSINILATYYDIETAICVILIGSMPLLKLLIEIYLKKYDPLLPVYSSDTSYALPIE